MNKKRRSALRAARSSLEKTLFGVTSVLEEEQDCLDNIPENLQSGEKYEDAESKIENLQEAVSQIENAIENIDEAI